MDGSDSPADPSTTDPAAAPAPVRKILHVDMDAFYASVEQRDRPELRGQPVAVGGSGPRGVVAAASYEARRFGVRSAMPSAVARRNCPELVFVAPRFEVYKAVSAEIRAILLDYTPLVEPLSLDEAYLDVTENLKGLASATAIAREIRARIFERTGLTASAGVSYNKFLAKLASDHRKPDGLTVIRPEDGPDFVAPLPVGRFHGIGPVTAEKMNRLGIFTGADLRDRSEAFLQEQFGKAGRWYARIAWGQDDRPVSADRVRKSVGSETTFARDLHGADEVASALRAEIDKVWAWCERTGGRGRTVTLKVRYADFSQLTRSRTGPGPVDSRDTLARIAGELAAALPSTAQGIRLLGVTLSGLGEGRAEPEGQLALGL